MGPLDPLLTLLAFGGPPTDPGRPDNGIPVREIQLSDGDRGARQMVGIMGQEARAALRNPLTFRAVQSIVPLDLADADRAFFIREWLRTRVFFRHDPHGAELLRTPDFLLTEVFRNGSAEGDCDDVATLAAALGLAAGLPARFVLLSFGASLPFSHVYTELWTNCQGWVEMDTTKPAQMPPDLKVIRSETHEV